MRLEVRAIVSILCLVLVLKAQTYSAPAGSRPAHRHEESAILPGGRVLAPLGAQYVTGAGPFGLAVNASARMAVTANSGPGRNSLSILERDRSGMWKVNHWLAPAKTNEEDADNNDSDVAGWRGVFMGVALSGDHSVWVSEGNSGKVSLLDWSSEKRRSINLNAGNFSDSYSGDLVVDSERNILYVVDQANFRVAVIDTRSRQIVASVKTGRMPFAAALSADRRKLYITNIGMFEYRGIPKADTTQAAGTGLPFPAFGFPSVDAVNGVQRATSRGVVEVPGLGDPNVREANSIAVIDVATPSAPKLETFVRTGLPLGDHARGGSSPSGILATADRIFVANTNDDSVTIIDAKTDQVVGEIPIRIPDLENLRGVIPIGMGWYEKNRWLLVAESGLNAVAVIDPVQQRVLGHLPVGWYPARVAIAGDTVFVANARGWGQGPSAQRGSYRQGSLSIFTMPSASELAAHTTTMMESNGLRARPEPPRPLPSAIKHVVLIVKEGRTYDEVFGDIPGSMGLPEIARFGMRGYVDGERRRVSLRDVPVTPNHHALAHQWAIGDNFYTDGDVSVGGHHWLVGSPPNAWTESSLAAAHGEQKKDFRLGTAPGRLLFAGTDAGVHPEEQLEGGGIWHHLERNGISFRNFGEGFELAGVNQGKDLEPTGARFLTNMPMPDPLYRHTSRSYPGFNMNIPDQFRAAQFISEIEERYAKGTDDLPRFLFVHLPNDHADAARPADGYPYRESYISDNDYALGRILEYLSHSKWWKEMAVFVTEADADGGIDHIDAHRTVLMAIGPYVKRGYITHRNSSFPGLLKTIFRLLGMPPLNLFDASATDLSDLFTSTPDFTPYQLQPVDSRIFSATFASRKPDVR